VKYVIVLKHQKSVNSHLDYSDVLYYDTLYLTGDVYCVQQVIILLFTAIPHW